MSAACPSSVALYTRLDPRCEYGRLPLDRFLLEHWDHTSLQEAFPLFDKLPVEIQSIIEAYAGCQQRENLVRIYVQGGLAIRTKYVNASDQKAQIAVPSSSDISTILKPFQTVPERNSSLREPGEVRIVRTCYRDTEADEKRHRQLINTFHSCRREPAKTLYNDRKMYSFSDPTEIFRRVPDLLFPQYFGKGSELGKRWWVVEPYLYGRGRRSRMAARDIASLAIVTWILVEDEVFFDGEDPLLLFCDEFGRVVVSRRAIDLVLAQRSQHMRWNGFTGNIEDEDISPMYREDGIAIKQWRKWLENEARAATGGMNMVMPPRPGRIRRLFGRLPG